MRRCAIVGTRAGTCSVDVVVIQQPEQRGEVARGEAGAEERHAANAGSGNGGCLDDFADLRESCSDFVGLHRRLERFAWNGEELVH